jgi:hypothetical protein
MVPRPVAVSIYLCDHVIVEKSTDKVSLIGLFERFRLASFPAVAPPFCVFARLTGGEGSGTIQLEIQDLKTLELLETWEQVVPFADRLAHVGVLFRLNHCSFPHAGFYQANLLVDGEWIAQQRFEVREQP